MSPADPHPAAGPAGGHPGPDGARRAVVRQAISVAAATGVYGISFGALSVAAGLDVWQTAALSLLMFTGGSQFAFVGVLGAGGAASPRSAPRPCSGPATRSTVRHWPRSCGSPGPGGWPPRT